MCPYIKAMIIIPCTEMMMMMMVWLSSSHWGSKSVAKKAPGDAQQKSTINFLLKYKSPLGSILFVLNSINKFLILVGAKIVINIKIWLMSSLTRETSRADLCFKGTNSIFCPWHDMVLSQCCTHFPITCTFAFGRGPNNRHKIIILQQINVLKKQLQSTNP